MGSDRAKVTYDRHQQYRSVVMQQGRVTLEADWNEAQKIASEELRHETLDIVGPAGTPDDGYEVDPTKAANYVPFDFTIGAGTMYVGGNRVVLPAPVHYFSQPDWLDYEGDPDWIDVSLDDAKLPGNEFVYLLLREQEVSAVEDPDLKDVALGGPDTAQRTRFLQHFVRVASPGADCASGLAAAAAIWQADGLHFNPHTMRLGSWSQLLVGFLSQPSNGPCEPQATGGYIAPDNQLIRVQLSGTDETTNNPMFLWGYDDASFLYRIDVDPNNAQNLVFESAPPDAFRQPQAGQAVEILRGAAILPNGAVVAAASGFVVTLDQNYQPGTQSITLPDGVFLPPAYLTANSSPPTPLYLRVWQEEKIFTSGVATALGSTGLQVTLRTVGGNAFHTGDFWLFAVRPATPTQVYPERYQNGFQFPDGPREWACPLGVISWIRYTGTLAADCRIPFDNLTDLSKRQEGCCTIAVRPSDLAKTSLQQILEQAVNSTMLVTAAAPGSAGNNITVSVSNINLTAVPATFDVTVTETDLYSGLYVSTITGILGGPQAPGSQPGLALVATATVTNGTISNQLAFFSGGADGSAAEVSLTDSTGTVSITLQARAQGTDGNLTSVVISNAGLVGAGYFDLTLQWSKTSAGVTMSDFLDRINSELSYDITASAPARGKIFFPSEGVVTLEGGVDADPNNNITAASATGYVFGAPATICLGPGSYVLQSPIRITREMGNLTIEGCGGAVTLSGVSSNENGFPAGLIVLIGARNLKLTGLTLALPAPVDLFAFDNLAGLNRAQIGLISGTTLSGLVTSIGIRVVGCRNIAIEDCLFRYPNLSPDDSAQFQAGIYANANCSAIRVIDNQFTGPSNLDASVQSITLLPLVFGYAQASTTTTDSSNPPSATVVPSTADDVSFERNRFRNLAFPISMQVPIGLVRADSNRVQSCLSGFALGSVAAVWQIYFGPNDFPDTASQQAARAFMTTPLIQNSFTVPSAIPLPAGYQPLRKLIVKPVSAAQPVPSPSSPASAISSPAGAPAATSPASSPPNPLLKLDSLQPFAARMMAVSGQSVVYYGPNPSLLVPRIQIAGNDMNVLPVNFGFALFVFLSSSAETITASGLLTMTGNTLTNQAMFPTVWIAGVDAPAIAANVIVNSGLATATGVQNIALWLLPVTNSGSIAGNVIRGSYTLPTRPAGDPTWDTYNDVS